MILETKPCWLVVSNSDRTEGRGKRVVIVVTWSRTTADRRAKGMGVMGSDADVQPSTAVRTQDGWLAVTQILDPSESDLAQDKLEEERQVALQKARDLGMSPRELEIIQKC